LLQNIPFVVWDNIRLGTAISSPTIEKVLTSSELEDRVLGVSRNERALCSTIQAFTGNNITAKGDMASRCLPVRINVETPDPENRSCAHSDPFAWTLDNRKEFIKHLYTILLGNPRLKQKVSERPVAKTRFKTWWHLVGSAVEYAAGLKNQVVDFQKLFLEM